MYEYLQTTQRHNFTITIKENKNKISLPRCDEDGDYFAYKMYSNTIYTIRVLYLSQLYELFKL